MSQYVIKHDLEGEEYYRCNHCGKESVTKKGINVHISQKHRESQGNKCYQCSECFVNHTTFTGLRNHHEINHCKENFLYCFECEKSYKKVAAWYKHKERNHPEKPHSKPAPQYEKYSISMMVKDPCDDFKERLSEWDQLYQSVAKPKLLPGPAVVNSSVLRDFCNRYWQQDLVYHFVTHPDSKVFGNLIYFVFPFGAVCSCNILKHMKPNAMPADDKKHMHYLVMLNPVLLDKNLKTYYMNNYTDSLNSTFFKVVSKMHMLNTALYILGEKSSSGVCCHNSGVGLTDVQKESIRLEVQLMDPTFQYSDDEKKRQKEYMQGFDDIDQYETVPLKVSEPQRTWTRWYQRIKEAEQDPPIHPPYFWDNPENVSPNCEL